MTLQSAPVALFAYRRPDHLSATLRSLAGATGAADTELHVFCDGPRDRDDASAVAEVRRIARAAPGFRSVTIHESDVNRGLAASVIDGVTRMLVEHESVIVLEDDMVVSVDFLEYLNQGIGLYASSPDVVSIHAFCVVTDEPMPQSFFLRGADCWGWATWRAGWEVFEPDGARLLTRLEDSGLARAFDLDGAYPYRQMLIDQVAGRVDSWAIRWHASAFLAGRLTLYPGRSLVRNTGQDGSGTHSGASDAHRAGEQRMHLPLVRIPEVESPEGRAAVIRALRRDRPGTVRSLAGQVLRRMRR